MPTYEHAAGDAVRHFASNPNARWYKKGIDVRQPDGDFAVQRLGRGAFLPRIVPEFSFDRSERLFAIGSCFARGIENYLAGKGYRIESAAREFDDFELSTGDRGTQLGFTNKYNTYAILYSLQWGLDPEVSFPEGALAQLDDETWIDPHTNPTLRFASRERTLERRKILDEVYSRIRDCRVVIITLGLIEAWLDRASGLYTNMSPLPQMREREPDRYSFQVLGYEENFRNLEEAHRLLSGFGHPDVQVVVTVSPVPLMATFTDRDVVVANAYSKSVLRAAAEAWSAKHENVHYFPSYEIVTMSDRDVAWEQDARHVQGALTSRIMKLFTDHYSTGE